MFTSPVYNAIFMPSMKVLLPSGTEAIRYTNRMTFPRGGRSGRSFAPHYLEFTYSADLAGRYHCTFVTRLKDGHYYKYTYEPDTTIEGATILADQCAGPSFATIPGLCGGLFYNPFVRPGLIDKVLVL